MNHLSTAYTAQEIVDKVREAGIVGAGGAGFPTHVKLNSKVDTYIVNAAECEPLLCKDQELMVLSAERMIHGLRLALKATGATRGVIAIKGKYKNAIAKLQECIQPGEPIEFYHYENFYPAGDEYLIVYDVTGRLIPPGGIPLNVDCAVNNVETFINISHAMDDQPVTHTALTIAGAVHNPVSAVVPVGITAGEALELAGGATVDEFALIDGGAMMGKLVTDLSTPITKVSGGFIVLPIEHRLIRRRSLSEKVNVQIAQSACDQCRFCTEMCPRYLLGYAVEPHAVMRSVGFTGNSEAKWAELGLLCCECNLCSLYACPEDLPPQEMCVRSKDLWRERGDWPKPLVGLGKVHPLRDSRRVPISRLVQRLGLVDWDVHAPMTGEQVSPSKVCIRLQQHIGAPATPVVQPGDMVSSGQIIAKIPEGKLGANIHASMDGRVSRIDEQSIWLTR